jgi:hypothetical protein
MTQYDPNHDKFDEERAVRVNQTNDGSGGALALAFWIAVLLIGGIVFFMSSPGVDTTGPQVTQNNTTAPAPAPIEPIQPPPAPSLEPPAAPATPPASQQ